MGRIALDQRPNVYILPERKKTRNPYKHRARNSFKAVTTALLLVILCVIGVIFGSHSSSFDPYVEVMKKKVSRSSNKTETKVDLKYMKSRKIHYRSWFRKNKEDTLIIDADNNGPIIDFAVVGFSHNTMSIATSLANLAPMPLSDEKSCTSIESLVMNAYQTWPSKYGDEKLFKGVHCENIMSLNSESFKQIKELSKHLPKTKLIIGIRHPVIWFKSRWDKAIKRNKIDRGANPYSFTELCVGNNCTNSCKENQPFCMHSTRFHLGIAKLGKTSLSDDERNLLSFADEDGGDSLKSIDIRNPIFIYDETELGNEYFWDKFANFVGAESIPHDIDEIQRQLDYDSLEILKALDICDDKYNDLRSKLMKHSYDMASWLQQYLLPASKEKLDINVAEPMVLHGILDSYKEDPCGKLVRSRGGVYRVNSE